MTTATSPKDRISKIAEICLPTEDARALVGHLLASLDATTLRALRTTFALGMAYGARLGVRAPYLAYWYHGDVLDASGLNKAAMDDRLEQAAEVLDR